MKKNYHKPSMKVVQLQHRSQLLQASPAVMSVRGNVFEDDIYSDDGYTGPTR